MPSFDGLAGIWKNLQELDVRPLREMAEQDIAVAIVGRAGVGKRTLASQIRTDPRQPAGGTQTPILLTPLEGAEEASKADLIIVMIEAGQQDREAERRLVEKWLWAGKPVLVLQNTRDLPLDRGTLPDVAAWSPAKTVTGSVTDRHFLATRFSEAVIELLPDRHLALGRLFPLVRSTLAQRLINEASLSNATYAVGTGVAEIVPVLNLPLNIADMVVLTKGQALLVYKLGLALGLPADWQYYVSELGGVIGSGFVWRQATRSLIGLVPGWGIVPKVAIAYAGTYVVGQAVLQWYLTGRHVSRAQIRELYQQAAEQGKRVAGQLLKNMPRPRLPRLRLGRPGKGMACQVCDTRNDRDASFCKKCGAGLLPQLPPPV